MKDLATNDTISAILPASLDSFHGAATDVPRADARVWQLTEMLPLRSTFVESGTVNTVRFTTQSSTILERATPALLRMEAYSVSADILEVQQLASQSGSHAFVPPSSSICRTSG